MSLCAINFIRLVSATALLAGCVAGCHERDAVRVKLHAQVLPEGPLTRLKIEAQVAGPTDGLVYKWFAVSGECEPQESDQPKTIFKFPEGVRQDLISVEIWRDNRRVAQGEIKVKYDDEIRRREQQNSPETQIEITTIPPAEPGGPDTHSHIDGKVSGKIVPGYVIVVYARAYGAWHIQPEASALVPIKPDYTWGSWTHTGTRYAALLARQGYEPLNVLDMLPQTNNNILAIDIVDGLPQSQLTNAASIPVPPSQ
jgi:hypothetical protein